MEGGFFVKQTERRDGARAALGAAVTLAAYLGSLALAALLLERGVVGEERAALCVAASACAAAFAGAKTAVWGAAKPTVPAAACVGAAYCAAVLLGFLTAGAISAGRAARLAASMAVGGGAALVRVGKRAKKRTRRARR